MNYETNTTAGAPGRYSDEAKLPTKAQRALAVKAVTAVLNGPETETYHLYRRGNMISFVKMKPVHKESA